MKLFYCITTAVPPENRFVWMAPNAPAAAPTAPVAPTAAPVGPETPVPADKPEAAKQAVEAALKAAEQGDNAKAEALKKTAETALSAPPANPTAPATTTPEGTGTTPLEQGANATLAAAGASNADEFFKKVGKLFEDLMNAMVKLVEKFTDKIGISKSKDAADKSKNAPGFTSSPFGAELKVFPPEKVITNNVLSMKVVADTSILAMEKGTIENIKANEFDLKVSDGPLEGKVIHYSNVDTKGLVAGSVAPGGTVGNMKANETLQISIMDNGKAIDPAPYITGFENKDKTPPPPAKAEPEKKA
ncbi:hypothetical protein KBD59_00180 [Candidatus Gracilibacteria bacterium]|nr:hypothetical protein [Candidatus Gracilibacteria bacterium]